VADIELLWDRLDETRPECWDPDAWAERLVAGLVEDGVDHTVRFGAAFDEAMDGLYRWDLWGVAFLAFGGLSDDGFEYLRCWVVAQGAEVWRRAQHDPEALFVELLGESTDPTGTWMDLGIHEAEPLLYVAGLAHEALTGEWAPPRGTGAPSALAGEPWSDDDLPSRFPRLASALPDDWSGLGPEDDDNSDQSSVMVGLGANDLGPLDPWMDAVVAGMAAFAEGDHAGALVALDPLVEDPDALPALHEVGFDVIDVCYPIAMVRFSRGDPEGAADVLSRASWVAGRPPAGAARRALAQVELALGHLAEAGALLDGSSGAGPVDRVLAAAVAWRAGDADQARVVIDGLALLGVGDVGHPWDLAGVHVQRGMILIELADADGAAAVADLLDELLDGAPADLPLVGEAGVIRAASLRLAGGFDDAREVLDRVRATLDGADAAFAALEWARLERASGRPSADAYDVAATAFDRAGERWWAAVVRAEAG
jgi:tetratricopeptide (TPR) repeat protein